MRSVRIIGSVLIKNEIAVQSINFSKYLPVGNPKILIDFLNDWGADEIIVLDIKGSINKNLFLKEKLKKITCNCNTPISAGGGIKNINDVEVLIRGGADKVIINTFGILNPKLLNQAALEFGNQAIIGAIDVKRKNNNYEVFTHSGTTKSKFSLDEIIKIYEDNQVGEIFINSIDNDGKKNGFDKTLVKKISSLTRLPIIISGGAGSFNHFEEILKENISGIASGNFLNFTEHSIKNLKYFLNVVKKFKEIRYEKNMNIKNFDFNYRYTKKDDKFLDELKYKEIIKNEIL